MATRRSPILPRIALAALAALLLGAATGCATATYRPPTHPVAYMVPTLVPGNLLRGLPRLETTTQELQRALKEAGCWEELATLGMPPEELTTLRRGLASRGYAEVDAHRCPGATIDRIVLMATPDGALRLLCRRRGQDAPTEHIVAINPAPPPEGAAP